MLGWVLGVCVWVTGLNVLGVVIRDIGGDSATTIAVSFIAQMGVGALAWLRWRDRRIVPQPVWITLAVLAFANAWTIGWLGAALITTSNLSADSREILAGGTMGVPTVGSVVARMVAAAGPFLLTAVLTFKLRRPGRVLPSRLGRIAFAGAMIALAGSYIWLSWAAAGAVYSIAGDIDQRESLTAGRSVSLVRGRGTVAVPSGWQGESTTDSRRPPRWMGLREPTADPISQSVLIREQETSSEATASARQASVIIVYSDQESWSSAKSSATETGAARPYRLPGGVLAGTPHSAFTRTARETGGARWRTTVSIFVPDPVAPILLRVILLHDSPMPPDDRAVTERLRPFHLKIRP